MALILAYVLVLAYGVYNDNDFDHLDSEELHIVSSQLDDYMHDVEERAVSTDNDVDDGFGEAHSKSWSSPTADMKLRKEDLVTEDCLTGWYATAGSDACLLLSIDVASHTKGNAKCKELHPSATLATISSAVQVATLCTLMRSFGTSVKTRSQLVHIGLKKDRYSNLEYWEDETPFSEALGSFSYWGKGEPDGRPPSWLKSKSSSSPKPPNYIAIDCRLGGRWVDIPSFKTNYACSMPKGVVTAIKSGDVSTNSNINYARKVDRSKLVVLKSFVEKDSSYPEARQEELDSWGETEPYEGACAWKSIDHTDVLLEDLETQHDFNYTSWGKHPYYAIWQNKIRFGYERYWVGYLEKRKKYKPLPMGETRDGKRTGYFHSTKYLDKYKPRAVFSRLLIPMPVLIKVPAGALVNQIFVGDPEMPTPLGDKPLLLNRLERYAKSLGCNLEDAGVFPLTYMLRSYEDCWSFHFKYSQTDAENKTWIVKGPLHSAKQLSIMNNEKILSHIRDKKTGKICGRSVLKRNETIQEYDTKPLLLADRKFDVRAFMLVASVRPLIVYVYNETYVRATVKTFADPLTTLDRSRHVTNTHVQKKALGRDFTRSDWESHIWDTERLKRETKAAGVPEDFLGKAILPQMKRILQFVIGSVADDIKVRRAGSWKLYGCDFLITKDLKATLVDVNPFPGWDWTFRTKFALAYRKRLFNSMYNLLFDIQGGAGKAGKRRVPQANGFHLIFHGKNLDDLQLTAL